ncbi:hypothetical protein AJ78_02693 [Emergomyces pasteurianus Ep9510]|uniref:DUF6536 domain-containing protein n=1 Tax=Emergomyces pasteurianus Ep9510 TaxID=1447872 RepID=A0A1J9PL09_9EURO|nr:hypothetical protein AJ78_02693 [Emergomyces pasteurianus Ep9510]
MKYKYLGDTRQPFAAVKRAPGNAAPLSSSSGRKPQGWLWPALPFRKMRKVYHSRRVSDETELIHSERTDASRESSTARLNPIYSEVKTAYDGPQNPNEPEVTTTKTQNQRTWIRGAILCAYIASFVLLFNVIVTLIAVIRAYGRYGSLKFIYAPIYEGKCSVSSNWNTALHFLINCIGAATLATSSYCMQCLGSPSRADTDRAHNQGKWLEIGTASISNFRFVGYKRLSLWLVLLLTSLPIHTIYNSVVFTSTAIHQYKVLIAPNVGDVSLAASECVRSALSLTEPDFLQSMPQDSLERLSPKECIDTFAVNYLPGRGTLMLLTNELDHDNITVWDAGTGSGPRTSMKKGRKDYDWLCRGEQTLDECNGNQIDPENWKVTASSLEDKTLNITAPSSQGTLNFNNDTFAKVSPCSGERPTAPESFCRDMETFYRYISDHQDIDDVLHFLREAENWANSSWADAITVQEISKCAYPGENGHGKKETFKIEGCLSEILPESCQLMFSFPIAITVLVLNFLNIACIFMAARDTRVDVLLTIGDAISSFLSRPDPNSRGRCLSSKSNVYTRAFISSSETRYSQVNIPQRLPRFKRWFNAVNSFHWYITVALYFASLAGSIYLHRIAFSSLKSEYEGGSLPGLSTYSSQPTSVTSVSSVKSSTSRDSMSLMLLANTPQLVVSISYFLYNKVVTSMLLAAEYNNYALHRRYLRVTKPQGKQRSELYISLPFKYGLPLIGLFAVLHWLTSQSLFFVQEIPFFANGRLADNFIVSSLGFSSIPMIIAVAFGSLMLIAIFGLSLKRFDSRMPLAANCSAGISAACHPPENDKDAAFEPVMWGEVVMNTSQELERLSTGGGDDETRSTLSRSSTATIDRGSKPASVRVSNAIAVLSSESTGVAHCSFTSHEVVTPSPRQLYS